MATDLRQSVRRLAQFRPFSDEGREMSAALEDLVVAAAAMEEGGFSSLAACQDAVQALWGLELEMGEIRACVETLEEQQRCVRVAGGFKLSDEERELREQAAAHSAALEATAFDEWRATLLEVDSSLTTDEFDELCHDLHTWLGAVVARHGVESALILYPENPRAQDLFSDLEALGLSFLPDRAPRIEFLRDRGFQLFVRQPTESQRLFLANLLNTSFYLTVLLLDSEGSRLIQERVAGHRIYLDTNVLYRVLGLAKATEVLATARLLDLTRDLGYELAVTPWTVRELRTSLDSARNRVTRRPLPRRELADLMVKAAGDTESFVVAFWRAYRDRGTQPKDFFEYFSHIESLLETHEVREVTEGCVAVDQDRTAIGEQLVVLERFLGARDREDRVKEHDVKHRLLVERLRGEGFIRFSNARYWFLTEDSKLPRYASTTLDSERVEMPFCVSASAWAQVVRAFTPRTADYEQTIVDLLATPYVRYRGAINPRVVEEVVGRIDQFEGADVRLASEVLADTALVREISQAESDEERLAKVENAFVVKSQELREKLEETERRARETATAADLAREAAEIERVRRLENEAQLARERLERREAEARLREELEATREGREAEGRQAEARRALHEAALLDLRDELNVLRNWLRWAGMTLLAALGLGVAIGPIASDRLESAGSQVVAILAGVLLLFGALLLGLGKKRGKSTIGWLVAGLGLVAAVVTLVTTFH